MSEVYLIAHKVRGEPAFDIAEQMEVEMPSGDIEVWWTIPTSGHRAYPFWHQPVLLEYDVDNIHEFGGWDDFGPMPPDLPDHYEVSAAPKGKGTVSGLFKLLFKPAPIKRRI